MHHSRLTGIIIDCRDVDGAEFWSQALGMKTERDDDGEQYVGLDASSRDLRLLVQKVSHESRVHLDLETDDEGAEVARLEALGAKKIGKVKHWTVMEAPTGQRFCVVQRDEALEGLPGINRWP